MRELWNFARKNSHTTNGFVMRFVEVCGKVGTVEHHCMYIYREMWKIRHHSTHTSPYRKNRKNVPTFPQALKNGFVMRFVAWETSSHQVPQVPHGKDVK